MYYFDGKPLKNSPVKEIGENISEYYKTATELVGKIRVAKLYIDL